MTVLLHQKTHCLPQLDIQIDTPPMQGTPRFQNPQLSPSRLPPTAPTERLKAPPIITITSDNAQTFKYKP